MQSDLINSIEELLDDKVRPALALHDGNVEVVGLDDGVLRVKLLGSCRGCPTADLTMESLVDEEVRAAFPQVKAVVVATGVSDDLLSQARALMTLH
jgi:Fe-S cluster biogenesis protein NfuA